MHIVSLFPVPLGVRHDKGHKGEAVFSKRDAFVALHKGHVVAAGNRREVVAQQAQERIKQHMTKQIA